MKIRICGGGPAGLYFALLAKRQDPRADVVVFEKNPRDRTHGWGVVFSDRTLSYLREADEPTWREITAAFETWDNVDIVHRGQKISVRGNRFSGIARIALLGILARRCEALGVGMCFETPVADPAALAAECDLLVGADGIGSAVRDAFRERFQPSFDYRANRYIWLGTPRLFHGLTLTFREAPEGVFVAHSYKFSKTHSTFVVECDPAAWERAGLAAKTESEALALLERVFAEDLGGAPLLSNQSKWVRFAVLRNARWWHENVVLLGDALHTVHFSIGSGTKLALEDAIALARALKAAGGAPAAALPEFERARRPAVEEYQAAAEESLVWFERAREHMRLDPIPFAWSCMTRSGRLDRESLARRDPEFVALYDRWRAGAAATGEPSA